MLKHLILLENKLIPDKRLELTMSLYRYISSSESEQAEEYHNLYDTLLAAIEKQSSANLDGCEHLYHTERLHDNLVRYHHLLLSITACNTKANNNTEELICLELIYLTGTMSMVVNITKRTVQIEFPSWLGYIETPDNLYLPYGIIPRSSGMYKTFKYKEKFIGLRLKRTES